MKSAGSTVVTPQVRWRVVLLAIAFLAISGIAAYMRKTAGEGQGLAAAIVLSVGAVAVAVLGGPNGRARQIVVNSGGITIRRFSAVRTRLAWNELETAFADPAPARLTVTPKDPDQFFNRHPELAREGGTARVGLGRDRRAAAALATAIQKHAPAAD